MHIVTKLTARSSPSRFVSAAIPPPQIPVASWVRRHLKSQQHRYKATVALEEVGTGGFTADCFEVLQIHRRLVQKLPAGFVPLSQTIGSSAGSGSVNYASALSC